MPPPYFAPAALAVALLAAPAGPPGDRKLVLVEAFVSQGCDLCPRAEELIGRLGDEFGPDRLAVVAFHVDYFDQPWKDPYSDPRFSRREWQYSAIYDREHRLNKPEYLYLTPLLMVDGRTPMVGSNEDAGAKARAAIRAALARRPEVALKLDLADGEGPGRKVLRVEPSALSPALAGREVLVQVVTVEDGLETAVESGELAGKTYRARFVARQVAHKSATLARPGADAPAAEPPSFPVTLAEGLDPARCRLIVLAQDEKTGRVYQAAQLPWPAPEAGPERAAGKAAR